MNKMGRILPSRRGRSDGETGNEHISNGSCREDEKAGSEKWVVVRARFSEDGMLEQAPG